MFIYIVFECTVNVEWLLLLTKVYNKKITKMSPFIFPVLSEECPFIASLLPFRHNAGYSSLLLFNQVDICWYSFFLL